MESASWRTCSSSGGVKASSQCGVERKYSSDLVGITFSMRNGITGMPLFTARSTSRLIWDCAALALEEKISTIAAGFVDGVDDAFAPVGARQDIARRDPAAHALGLQHGADRVRHRLVAGRITNEDVVRHSKPRSARLWPAELPGASIAKMAG